MFLIIHGAAVQLLKMETSKAPHQTFNLQPTKAFMRELFSRRDWKARKAGKRQATTESKLSFSGKHFQFHSPLA